jgi:hypothetical protein
MIKKCAKFSSIVSMKAKGFSQAMQGSDIWGAQLLTSL